MNVKISFNMSTKKLYLGLIRSNDPSKDFFFVSDYHTLRARANDRT